MKNYFYLTALCCTFLAGCSSSSTPDTSDENTNSGDNANAVLTGIFIDSAVEGLSYTTKTQLGVTSADGEFLYRAGESITFNLGSTTFPTIPAKGILTPVDLATNSTDQSNTVINISRFLQSLDQDGEPDNGIFISSTVAALSTELDFDVDITTFENNPDVINMVANSGSSNTSLLSVEESLQHLADNVAVSGVIDAELLVNIDQGNLDIGPTTSLTAAVSYSYIGEPINVINEFGVSESQSNPDDINNQIELQELVLKSCDANDLNIETSQILREQIIISMPEGGCVALQESGLAGNIQDTSDWPAEYYVSEEKFVQFGFNPQVGSSSFSANCVVAELGSNPEFQNARCSGWEFTAFGETDFWNLQFYYNADGFETETETETETENENETETGGGDRAGYIPPDLERSYYANINTASLEDRGPLLALTNTAQTQLDGQVERSEQGEIVINGQREDYQIEPTVDDIKIQGCTSADVFYLESDRELIYTGDDVYLAVPGGTCITISIVESSSQVSIDSATRKDDWQVNVFTQESIYPTYELLELDLTRIDENTGQITFTEDVRLVSMKKYVEYIRPEGYLDTDGRYINFRSYSWSPFDQYCSSQSGVFYSTCDFL